MDNVCIRVRFSPLIKDFTKSTYIEIVPLVSDIEDFEKIKWKHKTDEIEYIVPITYKILLKKRKLNNDTLKMYYSCVDLVPPSLSTVELGAGDLHKVLSDNLILLKEKSDCLKSKIIPTNYNKNSSNNTIELKNIFKAINDGTPKPTEENVQRTEQLTETENGILQEEINKEIMKLNKSTSIENHSYKAVKSYTCSKSMLMASNNLEHKRKLSITPVYTINTKDYLLYDKFTTNAETNPIAHLICELDNIKSYNVNLRRNVTRQTLFNRNHRRTEEIITSDFRIKPEIRIANFIQDMEKEILPLKIILNNIKYKCSSLGLGQYLFTNNNIQDKTVLLEDEQITKCDVREIKKHNRVVYSIVFDE